MKLKNILDFLHKKNTAGATLDELKNEFGDENIDDMKRLLQAGIDLCEIKKDGQGRGLRYYNSQFEIIKITGIVRQKHGNFVEEIDVTNCKTIKEKIIKVLESPFKLTQLHTFSYREKINDKELNRDLYDFIHQGAIDIDLNIAHDLHKHKNYIVSKNTKLINNKISITRINENTWTITKHFYECPDRPEIITFTKYEEFEKCLRSLLSK